MNADSLTLICECLSQMARTPSRHRNIVPTGHELAYINGLGFCLRFEFGLAGNARQEWALRNKAAEIRGFSSKSHPYEQMLERGLNADEILSELCLLEADFIRLAMGDSSR